MRKYTAEELKRLLDQIKERPVPENLASDLASVDQPRTLYRLLSDEAFKMRCRHPQLWFDNEVSYANSRNRPYRCSACGLRIIVQRPLSEVQ